MSGLFRQHLFTFFLLTGVSVHTLAFDIIVGGPPCADYSKVNANRQGTAGKQGQYMIRFGELIRKIERLQHPHPVFFLAENVFLSGHDRTEVMEAFGMDWDPIALDAQYLSPTRRNRHFVTNIPLSDVDFTKEISIEGPSSCLEEGFFVPAHLLDPEVTAKVSCAQRTSYAVLIPHSYIVSTGTMLDGFQITHRRVSDPTNVCVSETK